MSAEKEQLKAETKQNLLLDFAQYSVPFLWRVVLLHLLKEKEATAVRQAVMDGWRKRVERSTTEAYPDEDEIDPMTMDLMGVPFLSRQEFTAVFEELFEGVEKIMSKTEGQSNE